MNLNKIKTLFLREALELSRNFSLIFVLILFPIIVYPIILIYGAELEVSKQEKLEKEVSLVAIRNRDTLPELSDLLKDEPNIKIVEEAKIGSNCNLIIDISKDDGFFNSEITNYKLILTYESIDKKSEKALNRVKTFIADYKQELLYRRLDDKKLSVEFIEPIIVESKNTASAQKISGNILGDVIPLLIIMFILAGTVQVAVDITAGEKERKTMQTLLVNPVTRTEILISKLLITTVCSILSTTINFTSIALTFSFMPGQTFGLSLSPQIFILCIIALLPLVTLMSTLLLCLGIMAKNQIEASLYTMPVILLTSLPLIATQGMTSTPDYLSLIPIVNTSIALKFILMGTASIKLLAISFISNALYTAGLLLFTAKLFKNEDIALGGFSDIITQRPSNKELNPMDSIVLFCVSLFLYFYIGSKLQAQNVYSGLLYSQILFLLLPALIIARKTDFKKTFSLNKPPLYSLILAPFIGVSTIILASFLGNLQNMITPTPESINSALETMLNFSDTKSAILIVAITALTPAIFEELFFRGPIMQGFGKQIKGFWLCLLTGVLFATFHLNIYNILPLTFVGIILAAIVIKTRSIIPAMIVHLFHNGLQVLLKDTAIMKIDLQWYAPLIAIVFLSAVLFLPNRNRQDG